jgi:hypothetical protein
MRKIVLSWPALLSILMVSTSVSASACDLSCWLHQTPSDCHSANPATEDNERTMSASSEMDMSPEVDMSSHGTQNKAGPHHRVNAVTRHSMPAQMDMAGNSLQVVRKSEVSASARRDHSKTTLSLCDPETCSQTSASASPPRGIQAQPAHLHCVAIHVSSPANSLTSSHRIVPGTPSPINLAVDLLPTLRV